MIPIYFGSSERALYGVYHAPSGVGSRRGVVLCNPTVEDEYYNAHRTLRTVALRLAESGVHALRFDYLGTGDSAGEADDLGEPDWLADVETAVTELRDMGALRTVGLLGLRGGATLAFGSARRVGEVDRLVLWDPVRKGEPTADPRDPVRDLDAVLAEDEAPVHAETLLVTTGPDGEHHERLAERLASLCPRVDHMHHDEPGAWSGTPASGLPVQSLHTLVDWAREEP